MHLDLLLYFFILALLLTPYTQTDQKEVEQEDNQAYYDHVAVSPCLWYDEICLMAEVFLDVMARIANIRQFIQLKSLAECIENFLAFQRSLVWEFVNEHGWSQSYSILIRFLSITL